MRIHLIAIGGAVMHNLALSLQAGGHSVSGSDDEIFEPARGRLAALGLLPEKYGWDPSRISPDLDVVILGMHARADNPELLRAQELGLRISSFPEYLYEQTREKRRIVVAGSHGKTTITSMVMHALRFAGAGFDYMVGSLLEGFDTMVKLDQKNRLAVFEGDEYLSSVIDPRPKFLHYKPHILLISGIAWDHMNVFPDMEDYRRQFRQLMGELSPGGRVFLCGSDTELHALSEYLPEKVKPAWYNALEYRQEKNETLILYGGQAFRVGVFGKHNMENLSGAMEVCAEAGIERKIFLESMATFKGAAKRQEMLAEGKGLRIYLDFAHAPSKVKATVAAFRSRFSGEKLVSVLELHTFSSLNQAFLPQYKGSLDESDEALVFFSPEVLKHKNLPPLDEDYVRKCFGRNDLIILNERESLQKYLASLNKMSGVVLLMSSGNFSGLNLRQEALKMTAE